MTHMRESLDFTRFLRTGQSEQLRDLTEHIRNILIAYLLTLTDT